MRYKELLLSFLERVKSSSLAKDSFWSVFGNAVSMLILMICGIIIARVVGKDVYGQYGTVKNLMTSFASFAAFGFGYSSTKLISGEVLKYRGISLAAPKVVTGISFSIFLLILCFASPISVFLGKPDFKTFVFYIGILMFLKALYTVGTGILAGYKQFKRIGINAIISAFLMLIICYPFSKTWGLTGALIALVIYQSFVAFLSLFYAYRVDVNKLKYSWQDYLGILKITFPISIHEISATIGGIIYVIMLLHYSSYGDYALYSIAAQWVAMIIVIPTLLMNVTLSYLSELKDKLAHEVMVRRMLLINLFSSLLPLFLVLFGSNIIARVYGDTFNELGLVLKIAVFSSLFSSITLVYQSNLISEGRSWTLATFRLVKDLAGVLCLIIVLSNIKSINTAVIAVSVDLLMNIVYSIILFVDYSIKKSHKLII